MKVILKQETSELGAYGDIVTVARGHARNYLIPKGLAVEATPGNLRQFEAEKDAFFKKLAARKEELEKLSGELSAVTLTFTRKVGEDEKLFGSVTVHDIEDGLKGKGFDKVERKSILMAEPIKQLGVHTVEIKLHPEVTASISVEVVKE